MDSHPAIAMRSVKMVMVMKCVKPIAGHVHIVEFVHSLLSIKLA